jgi:hypothetical protein
VVYDLITVFLNYLLMMGLVKKTKNRHRHFNAYSASQGGTEGMKHGHGDLNFLRGAVI